MTTLSIIGSGSIGTAVARLAVAANIQVIMANSRGPESLKELIEGLGPLATADTVETAVAAGDIVLLSVPLTAITSISPMPFIAKTVLDTTNYYPFRDGRVAELDDETLNTSELVQRHFEGARLVKAFSNILAHHIPQLARPSDDPDRTALPITSDHEQAKIEAAALIDRLGYDTVDAGSLAESWRFEPEAGAYTRLYLEDSATPGEKMLEVPAAPVSAARL